MLLSNQFFTKEIKEKLKKYLEINENESTMIKSLWDTAKYIVRGKFIAIQPYLKKQEKSQVSNLTLHLKQVEKKQQTKPILNRRKEIIKTRAEINEMETKEKNSKVKWN